MPTRTSLEPGTPTPIREVPAHIPRPAYVWRKRVDRGQGSDVQDPGVIEAMRHAGKVAAGALVAAGEAVVPGVTTDEIDRVVHEYLLDHDAYPSTLGYPSPSGGPNFPKACCTSLNEVICHGIPDTTVIDDGDVVNVDVTAYVGGVHGDTNATFGAGDVAEDNRLLIERTREATRRAINRVAPGRPLNLVGQAIQRYAERFGYGVVREYTGHGIGRDFHAGLVVLHYDQPAVQTVLQPGMTFTIEPMISLGRPDPEEAWDDGWTIVTKDRSWVAQFEHTVLVTDDGVEILTLP